MIKIKYAHDLYWIKTDFQNRMKFMQDFNWNKARGLFFTNDPEKVKPYSEHCVDTETRNKLGLDLHNIKEALAKSEAKTSDLVIPKPDGEEYMGFQKAGVEFALEKFDDMNLNTKGGCPSRGVLIADEMGL